jgi:hypothetical protein
MPEPDPGPGAEGLGFLSEDPVSDQHQFGQRDPGGRAYGHSFMIGDTWRLLNTLPATRPGALRDLVEEQLRKFPGAAFTPHHIGKVPERSADVADHGKPLSPGPSRPSSQRRRWPPPAWKARPIAPRSVPGERLHSGP